MDFEIKLKDGNCAFIKNLPPETISFIKKCEPKEGEFVLEAHKGGQFFNVDVKDIESEAVVKI